MTPAVRVAYGNLLKARTPHAIHNEKEYTKAWNEVRTLMLEDTRSAEKTEYLKLLATLVEAYEREHVSIPKGSPLDILHELMDARNMKQADLAKLTGSSGTASEIYHGKREISKALARRFGDYFGVAYTLFL